MLVIVGGFAWYVLRGNSEIAGRSVSGPSSGSSSSPMDSRAVDRHGGR
jgi:hypothetical protein